MTYAARLRLTALGLTLLALSAPAMAQPNSLVDVRVVNRDTGAVLQTWYHHGRLYVAGQPGARYGLRFVNHTGQRLLAVASVDGVNIITGETANFDERGYVLSPWQTIDVNGWRKSDTTIAAFAFAPLSSSYAARTGRPGDVGVIGVAVFEERKPPPPPPMLESDKPNFMPRTRAGIPMPAPMAAPPPPADTLAPAQRAASPDFAATAHADEKLGTGHGASEWSVIETVPFVRASKDPQAVTAIEYDTREHLIAHGIIPAAPDSHPRPFPGEARVSYVPDPPP